MNTSPLLDLNLQAQEHLRSLIFGLHPKTNQRFSPQDVFCDADILRSLVIALEALEQKLEGTGTEHGGERVGKPWTAAEDRELSTSFGNGAKLDEIVSTHQRRSGGIIARLVHLDLAGSRDEVRIIFRARAREVHG